MRTIFGYTRQQAVPVPPMPPPPEEPPPEEDDGGGITLPGALEGVSWKPILIGVGVYLLFLK